METFTLDVVEKEYFITIRIHVKSHSVTDNFSAPHISQYRGLMMISHENFTHTFRQMENATEMPRLEIVPHTKKTIHSVMFASKRSDLNTGKNFTGSHMILRRRCRAYCRT